MWSPSWSPNRLPRARRPVQTKHANLQKVPQTRSACQVGAARRTKRLRTDGSVQSRPSAAPRYLRRMGHPDRQKREKLDNFLPAVAEMLDLDNAGRPYGTWLEATDIQQVRDGAAATLKASRGVKSVATGSQNQHSTRKQPGSGR